MFAVINLLGGFLSLWVIFVYDPFWFFNEWKFAEWAMFVSPILFIINFFVLLEVSKLKDNQTLLGLWFEVRRKRLRDELKDA